MNGLGLPAIATGGEAARDFFLDFETHAFPYGDSYVMDPALPGDDEAATQRQLCATVDTWVKMLLDTLDELLQWKDHVVTLAALPTTALSTLAVLSSKLCRCKSHIRSALPQLLSTTDDLIGGVLLNEHIRAYKTNMVEMAIAMDHEKMVLTEEQVKLRAALAQMTRMKSAHRVFRWSRLSSRLRERELRRALDNQHCAFETKREELHSLIERQRQRIEALERQLEELQTYAQHTPLKKPPSPPRPEAPPVRTFAMRKNRVMSAPSTNVAFPRRNALDLSTAAAIPSKARKWLRPPKQSTNNQDDLTSVVPATPKKAVGICRPRTSNAVVRKKPLLLYHEDAANERRSPPKDRDPDAMSLVEHDAFFGGTWDARRDGLRRSALAKQDATALKDERIPNVPESDDGVALYAVHHDALVTRVPPRTQKRQ
ncbi:hypothetical protein SDRG_13297 [Saprolegnia diclina VS20]|uniref:Uncharacterized protein n=1 Tax=Saprolegnia diclina (strain VS20) TaxID=1156394 RepID=T0Q6A3_SAPDV|nr:hypothetical protein SDRG_13297 [Saprolegnia diclina VS20]EQC28960.1 hypothetical protein SDRG_13297 [Saprolegnia diclina VS20]|eukprot:XP_008617599.1 hypothetical protein SDRG_13297 [Saprolegnia diclina VS20]